MPQSTLSLQVDSKRPREDGAAASEPTLGNNTGSFYCNTTKEESEQTDSLNHETLGGNGKCSAQEIITRQPERTKRWPLSSWVSEVVAIMVSAGAAATIAVLLRIYDHRPIPRLTGAISINAVLAVLSTVAKSSLLYAITAVLGQAKWDWYCRGQQSKRLIDMETFDQASRGPLGAAKVLLSRRTVLSPTSVGALVVILCLLVDPFTQQVVGWAERKIMVPSEEVWTPKATTPHFCPSLYSVGGRLNECQSGLADAVNAGIWTGSRMHQPDIHCSTGECEWEPFETIELCMDHQVVEPSRAHCNISFNQTRFNKGFQTYNSSSDTYVGPVWSNSCDLFPGFWNFTGHERIDYVGTSSRTDFPGYGGAMTVQTGLRMGDQDPRNTSTDYEPYLLTRFPAEIITWLPINSQRSGWDYKSPQGIPFADVENGTDIHIPSPHLILAHTRFALETFQEGVYTRVPRELRAEITEWAALSLCKVKKQVTVQNGVARSSIISSTRLQAQSPVSLANRSVKCWGPHDLDLGSPSMAWLSEPPSDEEPNKYRTDPSTGAFCLFDGADVSTYEITQRVDFVLRWTIRYNSTGHTPDGHMVDGTWERDSGAGSFYPVLTTDVPDHISKRGLGPIMTSIVASINDLALSTHTEKVIGSYVVRERILEVRWPWLAPLFLVELLGIGYLLFMVFRSRPSTVGGVWKDSILAVLYHGLDNGAKYSQSFGSGRLADMRKVAQSTNVHLEHSKGVDGRVVLVQDNDDGINRSRILGEENI